MGEFPRVSIITPSLNQGKYIRQAIDSVLSQDYPDIEYIVADGGSTDDTVTTLQSYGNRLIWWSKPDGGQAAAINAGMRISSGLILFWLNSDDTLLPGTVSAVVEAFRSRPKAGVIYGDTLFVDPEFTPLFVTKTGQFFRQECVESCRNPIPQPSAFIRREAWEDLDENLTYFMDWDLWLRVSAKWPIVLVPEIWSTYRLHPESKTGAARYPAEELEYIYRKQGLSLLTRGLYERMAEYHAASGKHWKAFLARRRAWLTTER